MDKFDIVMAQMEKGLAVALDSQFKTLERGWVVSEIWKSLDMEMNQKRAVIAWQMPNQFDDRFGGSEDIRITNVSKLPRIYLQKASASNGYCLLAGIWGATYNVYGGLVLGVSIVGGAPSIVEVAPS